MNGVRERVMGIRDDISILAEDLEDGTAESEKLTRLLWAAYDRLGEMLYKLDGIDEGGRGQIRRPRPFVSAR